MLICVESSLLSLIVIVGVLRLEEIDLMKKQYEHWLTEKDKALSGPFVI